MATRALTLAAAPKTYAELRSGVESALLTGQRLIERAKVRTYWETGRLIQQHLLLNAERAAYGTQVIPRLARDLDVGDRVLYQCLQFCRAYPILHDRAEFTWAHYRVLIQIADPKQRKAVEAEALKKDWTSSQLEARVRELSRLNAPSDNGANGTAAPKLLTPKRGTPGLHLIAARDQGLAVDLGFKLYRPLSPDQVKRFEPGSIVRLCEDRITRVDDATKAHLFTYAAVIRRVIDGDTLVVELEVAPVIRLELKLRLRGLDCPELPTAEGRAAKSFVDALVKPGAAVTLSTTKPDKYDRYLADLFLATDNGEIFLNNVLLENGHAVTKNHYASADWDGLLA